MENEILIYQSDDGITKIDVRLEKEDVFLNQNQLAILYQTSKQNVSLHLSNIYKENELNEELTVKEYLTVQQEGNRNVQRPVKYYNLDAIIKDGMQIGIKFKNMDENLKAILIEHVLHAPRLYSFDK